MRADRPLKPLLLLFAARSGSTLLMQLLGTSAQIVFERESPFEMRHLTYWLRWSWQLANCGARPPEWSVDRLVREQPQPGNRVEPPPFPMPAGFAVDSERPLWHDAFRTAWAEYSRRARRRRSCSPGLDPDATWYAEKSRTPYRGALQQVGIAHRAIYLLRDPRDILESIWAFNKKRGTTSFAVREGEDKQAFMRRFLDDRRRRMRVLLEMVPHDPDSTIVRYEDMILDMSAVAERLSQWLGVTLDAQQVSSQQQAFAHHMSSKGPRASIGRWRTELDGESRKMFADKLGVELQALGYEV